MFNRKPDKTELIKENTELKKIIEEQSKEITVLKSKISELEERVNKNSRNSHKPPSTDTPFEKRLKNRKRKKKQAQKKPGVTLERVAHPDEEERLDVDKCSCCGTDLSDIAACGDERRQEFDIPPIKVQVKEYVSETKECPFCGSRNKADFPVGIESPVQYGPNIRSLAVYLRNAQYLPLERLCELFNDVLGTPVSEGSLVNMTREAFDALEGFESGLKEELNKREVLHADETGVRVGRDLNWLHVVSDGEFTYLHAEGKRGVEGMNQGELLPLYEGVVCHDGWESYRNQTFSFVHALCNAHHLRELRGAWENHCQPWACDLIELLLRMKELSQKNKNGVLSSGTLKKYHDLYDEILKTGFEANPPPVRKPGQRGRLKKGKVLNLLERLREYKEDVLRFASDPKVPFDNNQAERDLRMAKVRQKISGCFRNLDTAGHFCRIHSFISSVRKHDGNVLEAIKTTLAGGQYITFSQ